MAAGPVRVAVLLSGRGSNFVAIHGAVARGELPADIRLVVSNRPDALGLEHARERGVRALAIPHRQFTERAQHEEAVLEVLRAEGVEWVCLAGYLRLLSAGFVGALGGRITNVHPSLLPSFPGLDAQQQALDHGVRVTGCTVHLVDPGLDSGPIVLQRAVPVQDDDTAASLSARILEQEHVAYPEALCRLFTERWQVSGRRVVFGRSSLGE